MTIIPNQYFGIGDIIFEQTVVRNIAGGEPIIWPVMPQFVEGLQRAYPDIAFCDMHSLSLDYNRKDEYTIRDMRVLPLRWADSICKVPYTDCMASKYLLYDMDWQTWKEKAMWQRDTEREEKLKALLQLPKEYNLINRTFGSESQLKAAINVENGLTNIYMRTVPGFSLFDWAGIIQGATHIHTVSTSIIYVLELLKLKASEVHMYPRHPIEAHFKNVDYILQSHKYVLHD